MKSTAAQLVIGVAAAVVAALIVQRINARRAAAAVPQPIAMRGLAFGVMPSSYVDPITGEVRGITLQ